MHNYEVIVILKRPKSTVARFASLKHIYFVEVAYSLFDRIISGKWNRSELVLTCLAAAIGMILFALKVHTCGHNVNRSICLTLLFTVFGAV